MQSSKIPFTWIDIAKMLLGVGLWLVLLALTFYSLFTLPVLLLAGAYVAYLIARMRAKSMGPSRRESLQNDD